MITRKNEPKILTKDISCECKCKFDRKKYTSDQWWNNDRCRCQFKKRHYVKKSIFGIQLHVAVNMENI